MNVSDIPDKACDVHTSFQLRRSGKLLLIWIACWACFSHAHAGDGLLNTTEIRIRDPYIYPDTKSKTYFMYAQSANRENSGFIGVEAYASRDMVNWQPPRRVLVLSGNADIKSVWAPEMHNYKDKYYLFVTLTYGRTLPEKKPVETGHWPVMHIRGIHIFQSDNPLGPFEPLKSISFTPENWMALDGTLFVEKGTPYMVFCHEWVQTIDGTIYYVQLKDYLSGTIGQPLTMFKASSAPGASQSPMSGKVTDGCFLYRSPRSDKLFMIWSTNIPGKGYCVVLAHSESGSICGPWKQQKLMYTENGGHGMLFKSFEGRLIMALHQPNSGNKERLHLFEVSDNGEMLEIVEEIKLRQ